MTLSFHPEGTLQKNTENKEMLLSPATLERARLSGKILEAPAVLCDSELSLHIDLGCMRGIIPREEALYCRPGEAAKDIAIITRVGKPVAFKILNFIERDGECVALLSRRAVQRTCVEQYLTKLVPGDIIPARVTHLENYGAFLDVGCGVSTLLSIDCISVSRISHPRDRLSVGMNLYVVVKSVDPVLQRITVTLKELLGTWEENAARFTAGQTVVGRVRSVESYGIFVELAPNLAGLAELRGSESTQLTPVPGELAAVFIKSILPERMKVKLVMIDARDDLSPPESLSYYIDPQKTRHIDRWEYSPKACSKKIETVFE